MANGDMPSLETQVLQKLHASKLTKHQKWLAVIWAARDQVCPECKARPNRPCLHLGDIKKKISEPKQNKWPHSSRVNWAKLMDALRSRGY